MTILLEELHKAQTKEGYVSEKAMKAISIKLNIPISRVYGATTFYTKIYTQPQGKFVIEICNSPSCYLNNSLNLIKYLEKKLQIKSGQTTKNKKFSLHICSCIGCCNKAPAMLINDKQYTNLTKEKIDEILKKCKS